MARRVLVVDPATNEVVNAILVPDHGSFELPGMQLIEDQWGAGPGDRWDPAAKRAERVERPAPQPSPLDDIAAKIGELQAAVDAGDAAAAGRVVDELKATLDTRKPAIVAAASARSLNANG